MIKIRGLHSMLCPVRAMCKYILFRGNHKGNIFCLADGTPVKYNWYRDYFKSLVKFSDLDLLLLTHSVRIGEASYAVAAGFSEDQIKRMGQWVSSAVKNYIKLPVICF